MREYTDRARDLSQLFLELTPRCNLSCAHCGSECSPVGKGAELTGRQWMDFISDIAQKVDRKQLLFCLTGGEPLLRDDFFMIADHIHALGFRWGLTTNGTLINRKIAQKLFDAGMASVSVSLDGTPETHDRLRNCSGAYERAVGGLRELIRRRTNQRVQVTTVVNKQNIHELMDIYYALREMRVYDWRIATVDPIGRAKDQADLLLDAEDYMRLFQIITELRTYRPMNVEYGCAHYLPEFFDFDLREMPFRCGAGDFIASVLYNGDIFSCVDIERRPELIQGNILKDNFMQVWEHEFAPFRGEERTAKSKKCKECIKREVCNGDSAHTWDYDNNEPRLCLTELLKKAVYDRKNLCGCCGREMVSGAKFCDRCGTPRGEGSFTMRGFDRRYFQTLYGPPSIHYAFTCKRCGTRWTRRDYNAIRYCHACGWNDLDKQPVTRDFLDY